MEHFVAGENLLPVKRDVRIAGGFGSGGDDDFASFDQAGGAAVDEIAANAVGAGKGRRRDDRLGRAEGGLARRASAG